MHERGGVPQLDIYRSYFENNACRKINRSVELSWLGGGTSSLFSSDRTESSPHKTNLPPPPPGTPPPPRSDGYRPARRSHQPARFPPVEYRAPGSVTAPGRRVTEAHPGIPHGGAVTGAPRHVTLGGGGYRPQQTHKGGALVSTTTLHQLIITRHFEKTDHR